MDIVSSLLSALSSEPRVMLATIISTSGSTPASALSKMIITNEGKNSIGTVGGGCMEGDVLHGAKDLFPMNKAAVMTFHLNEEEMIQGLICGGTVNILLEPVGQESRQLYEELQQIRDNGDDCIVATHVTNSGEIRLKSLVKGDSIGRNNPVGDYLGTTRTSTNSLNPPEELLHSMQKALHRAETQTIVLPDGQLILEPVFGRPHLLLFGGGHVSRYLSRTASMAGFRVTVVDDRPQYANPERFPEADATLVVEFYEALSQIEIKQSTYVVIVTRGHRSDEDILEQVIRTPAKYIGMIGSARKVLTTYEHLVERGVTRDDLTRVHAPMGLEIGAATAEEIAVSVVAEMIQVRRSAHPPAESKSTPLLSRLNKL